MSTLSIVGTAAMFLVGGGILVHGMPITAAGLHIVEVWAHSLPTAGGIVGVIASMLYNGLLGFIAGGVIVGVYLGFKRLLPNGAAAH
jgi:predicted DNA repair protein MutK